MLSIMENTGIMVMAIMVIMDITETRDIMPSTVSTMTQGMGEETARERRELEREASTSRRAAERRKARTRQAALD